MIKTINKDLETIKIIINENEIIKLLYDKYLELKSKFHPETDEHILEYLKDYDNITKEENEIINNDKKELNELQEIFETKLINLIK